MSYALPSLFPALARFLSVGAAVTPSISVVNAPVADQSVLLGIAQSPVVYVELPVNCIVSVALSAMSPSASASFSHTPMLDPALRFTPGKDGLVVELNATPDGATVRLFPAPLLFVPLTIDSSPNVTRAVASANFVTAALRSAFAFDELRKNTLS